MQPSTYKRIRMALGLSQQELADKLNVTANYVAMIESGRRGVSELQCLKMIDLLMDAYRNGDLMFELFKQILLGEKPNIEQAETKTQAVKE